MSDNTWTLIPECHAKDVKHSDTNAHYCKVAPADSPMDFQLHVLEPVQYQPLRGHDDQETQLGLRITRLPIMQLYGRDAEGQSVCVNVHGAFPFIFCDYPVEAGLSVEAASVLIGRLAAELNAKLGQLAVHRIFLVKGRRFYGFDAGRRLFLKLTFLNPIFTKKAANLIHGSQVSSLNFTGRDKSGPVRVYEAHVPFELQFMMEHNLFGMGTVRMQNATMRPDQNGLYPTSRCDMEYDVQAGEILNRHDQLPFRNARPDAHGLFPRGHMMPSVVEMLNSMSLDINVNSQDPVKPLAAHIDRSEQFHNRLLEDYQEMPVDEQLQKFASALPDACDYDLAIDRNAVADEFKNLDWPSSPLGGSQFSRNIAFYPTTESRIKNVDQQKDPESSPFKTPSKVRLFEQLVPSDENSEGEEESEVLSESIYSTQPVDTLLSQPSLTASQRENVQPGMMAIEDTLLSTQIVNSPTCKRRSKSYLRSKGPFKFAIDPPSYADLLKSFDEHSIPHQIHQQPYYSDARDASDFTFAGVLFRPPIINISTMDPFHADRDWRHSHHITGQRILRPVKDPPSVADAISWLNEHPLPSLASSSQLDLSTPNPDAKAHSAAPLDLPETDRLCMLSVEVFAESRGLLLSDPEHDAVVMVVYAGYTRDMGIVGGCITWRPFDWEAGDGPPFEMSVVDDEAALLDALVSLVNDRYDGDVLVGYEVSHGSWGYLQDRCLVVGKYDLMGRLSRKRPKHAITEQQQPQQPDPWSLRKTSGFQVFGRIVLNVWRIMRNELVLSDYSFESVSRHVLSRHEPLFSQPHLLAWFNAEPDKVMQYYYRRALGNITLLIRTEVLTRSCEFARLFGVDFFSVHSRGSQFKVESLMIRLAHLEGFLALTPAKFDIAEMRAPECLQLIMEPESRMYVDPVVVLDFQSLYPSVMIAYNYCFSTCLGRVGEGLGSKTLGAGITLDNSYHGTRTLAPSDILVSPNGVAFVKTHVRQGTLPKMLIELLDARLQIKSLMGQSGASPRLKKVLDARQLGIKYILNVTYGYTAASYSGRMPCVDIADSIVATGRATLEHAIRFIEQEYPGCRVVYGDTDSLFVEMRGRTRTEAFAIGRDMARSLTAHLPHPMALKFEKVYHPCILQTKKRYCGMRFDDEQGEGKFEGKGIETVRRDTCPLVARVLERATRLLFRTRDLSVLKDYLQRQFGKVIAGARHDFDAFVFAREVRFGTYSGEEVNDGGDSDEEGGNRGNRGNALPRPTHHLPPSAIISLQRSKRDPRDIAQYGERIAYVVVYGRPDARLIDLVVPPTTLLSTPTLRINGLYYVQRHLLPVLQRMFGIVGVDVGRWWREVPRPAQLADGSVLQGWVVDRVCLCCGHRAVSHGQECIIKYNEQLIVLCGECRAHPLPTIQILMDGHMDLQDTLSAIREESRRLCGCGDHVVGERRCVSVGCPLFWRAVGAVRREVPMGRRIEAAIKYLNDNV